MSRVDVTIRDVARKAGISIGTVSLALNDRPAISAATRERVKQVAAEMGYVPSPIGKALNRKKSGIVGVVVPVAVPPLFPEIIDGINEAAESHGMPILFSCTQERVALEARSLRIFSHIRVDGVIVACNPGGQNRDLLKQLAAAGTPVVHIERCPTGVVGDYVGSENQSAAHDYTRRLIQLGHDRVGCVLYAHDYNVNKERHKGYCDALVEAGIQPREEWVFRLAGRRPADVRDHIREYLTQPGAPRAMLWTTTFAGIMADVLAELELVNGRNIEVVIFDGNPFEDLRGQQFVNVTQDANELGRVAFCLLTDQWTKPGNQPKKSPRVTKRIHCLETMLTGMSKRPAE